MTSDKGRTTRPGKPGSSQPRKPDFYTRALSEAEQEALGAARTVEGLDEEVAMLRVKLLTLLTERPDDYSLIMRGVELMVKAVSARYRISGKSEDDLYQSVVGVLKGMGEALGVMEETRA